MTAAWTVASDPDWLPAAAGAFGSAGALCPRAPRAFLQPRRKARVPAMARSAGHAGPPPVSHCPGSRSLSLRGGPGARAHAAHAAHAAHRAHVAHACLGTSALWPPLPLDHCPVGHLRAQSLVSSGSLFRRHRPAEPPRPTEGRRSAVLPAPSPATSLPPSPLPPDRFTGVFVHSVVQSTCSPRSR